MFNNITKKYIVLISSGLITVILISVLCIVYINLPVDKSRYQYPEPFFIGATYSNMAVESDSLIHFALIARNSSKLQGLVYAKLDTDKNAIQYEVLTPGGGFMYHYQIRIILDPDNTPYIYHYFLDGWGVSMGAAIKARINNTWIYPNFYTNHSYPKYRGELLNWLFSDQGEITYAFIGREYGYSSTPVLFNETTDEFHFLNNTFLEISNSFTPGDICLMNGNLALLWTKLWVTSTNTLECHPVVAINWTTKGWELYDLGTITNQFYAIKIIPENDVFHIFYYDKGEISLNPRIFMTSIHKQGKVITRQIAQFDTPIYFYEEAISDLGENKYAFIYSKKAYNNVSQRDLFLGVFNDSAFREVRLTETPEHTERWAYCKVSENYLHYGWTQHLFDGTEREIIKANLFYNRLLLSEIDNFSLFNVNNYTQNMFLFQKTNLSLKENHYLHTFMIRSFHSNLIVNRRLPIKKNQFFSFYP